MVLIAEWFESWCVWCSLWSGCINFHFFSFPFPFLYFHFSISTFFILFIFFTFFFSLFYSNMYFLLFLHYSSFLLFSFFSWFGHVSNLSIFENLSQSSKFLLCFVMSYFPGKCIGYFRVQNRVFRGCGDGWVSVIFFCLKYFLRACNPRSCVGVLVCSKDR